MEDKTIDIEDIFRKKFNGKAPWLLTKVLKRLIHQDFINEYLKQGYEGVEFCENAIKYLNVRLRSRDLKTFPMPLRRG